MSLVHSEIDERAFAIFLLDGIYYLLQQDVQLRNEYMINFCNRLWHRWVHLPESEKDPYWDRAAEELRRLRRNSGANVFREVLRDTLPDNDETRHTRRFLDRTG